ncbi:MAG: 50S ribosomal protein L4 [Candidatus Neomarinimicrobiota bacterium]|jgi:large subunit ribosomal protein L4|nr:50S ribosomal protein L4 [Candidatus Neomarinimicrobiota bacterium]
MKLDVYKSSGEKLSKKVELAQEVFGIEPNEHTLYLAVKAELANMRQGTHKTKTRGEVRGGGAKPWRQKGRGTARSGSRRSPVWVGGGRAFGPEPHLYTTRLPKKVKRLARRSALSQKVNEKAVLIVDDFKLAEAKTRDFAAILSNLGLSGKKLTVLVVGFTEELYLAARNIPNVYIVPAERASTYEIMDCDTLVIEQSAVEILNEALK